MRQQIKDFIIHPIPVLTDNIIWIWVKENQAVVIDPAISEPIINWLKSNELDLKAVLQTHHHEDHIGGTESLLRIWPTASVIAAKADIERIPFQTHSVINDDKLVLMGEQVKVLEVPGHTKSHVSYYLSRSKEPIPDPVLFCGDTLFGGGCGRLFEGTPNEMFTSLNRFKKLPGNTKVYCAHEYTEANLIWARSIYPEDSRIKERLQNVKKQRAQGLSSLPSTITEERETNLFLRAKTSKEFSELRLHKDNWKS